MPETSSSSSSPNPGPSRVPVLGILIAVLFLTTVAGWWVAWEARRQLSRIRGTGDDCTAGHDRDAPDPRGAAAPSDARVTSRDPATTSPDSGPAPSFDACLRDPRVQAHLDRRLREASRMGAIAGSDAARRAEIEKAMKRRYDALERTERAQRAALTRLAQERDLDDATRSRLEEALKRQVDDETESFLQFKEGKLTDREHFAEIQSGSARVNEAFTSLIGADGLLVYKKLFGSEFQKEMEKLDKEEGYK
ncbi:hypothetical protein KKC22_00810 [Myxococcota bacterium]|nr:hypothetical protein [Myxococcota bacterium]